MSIEYRDKNYNGKKFMSLKCETSNYFSLCLETELIFLQLSLYTALQQYNVVIQVSAIVARIMLLIIQQGKVC